MCPASGIEVWRTAHYQGINLVLSWNWWMTNARTVSQLSTEMTLHRTVELILNRTLSRMIHKMSQNLSDDIPQEYVVLW